jgi:hypothetical protein
MQGVYANQLTPSPSSNVRTYRSADLKVKFARGVPVVHGIESGDLIDTHWWHLQYPCNLIHDADARKPMLSLTKVQKWHDSGLLVLRRIARNDLLDKVFILRSEFEGDFRVVLRSIAVLEGM